jgi:hypothetical protein
MALVRRHVLSRENGGKAFRLIEKVVNGKEVKVRLEIRTWCLLFEKHPPKPQNHALCSGVGLFPCCLDYRACMRAIRVEKLLTEISKKRKRKRKRKRKDAKDNTTKSKQALQSARSDKNLG